MPSVLPFICIHRYMYGVLSKLNMIIYHKTSDVEFKDTFLFADVNDQCVHSDGQYVSLFYRQGTQIMSKYR
jgi:hypothetical protein